MLTNRHWRKNGVGRVDKIQGQSAGAPEFQAKFFKNNFYRAMLCILGTSHGPVSVCLSVSVSVCHKSVFY